MKSELIVAKTNAQERKVFLQDEFYALANQVKKLHSDKAEDYGFIIHEFF